MDGPINFPSPCNKTVNKTVVTHTNKKNNKSKVSDFYQRKVKLDEIDNAFLSKNYFQRLNIT